MLEACMDESGIHDGAHVCVVAGYWGSVKKWKRFESRWKQIIKETNEPTLKEFHSTEFWNSKGERHGLFAQWSDAKADKFIDALADCIVDSKVFPTSAVLVTEEWKKLTREERMFLTGGIYDPRIDQWSERGAPNRIYFYPFSLAVANPAIGCPAGLHVHYVFDLNKQFKHHALKLYELLKRDKNLKCRHQLGGIDFENGGSVVGLQAADLLAYQTYKHAPVRIAAKRQLFLDELPPLLKKLVSNARFESEFPFLDGEGLNLALQHIPPRFRGPRWHPTKTEPR